MTAAPDVNQYICTWKHISFKVYNKYKTEVIAQMYMVSMYSSYLHVTGVEITGNKYEYFSENVFASYSLHISWLFVKHFTNFRQPFVS